MYVRSLKPTATKSFIIAKPCQKRHGLRSPMLQFDWLAILASKNVFCELPGSNSSRRGDSPLLYPLDQANSLM